jgi:hypothetical protein
MEVQHHDFSTLALDEREWLSASSPSLFTSGERVLGTHWRGGWVWPQTLWRWSLSCIALSCSMRCIGAQSDHRAWQCSTHFDVSSKWMRIVQIHAPAIHLPSLLRGRNSTAFIGYDAGWASAGKYWAVAKRNPRTPHRVLLYVTERLYLMPDTNSTESEVIRQTRDAFPILVEAPVPGTHNCRD